jgi:DNA-binding NarL/FixJ family response regulator
MPAIFVKHWLKHFGVRLGFPLCNLGHATHAVFRSVGSPRVTVAARSSKRASKVGSEDSQLTGEEGGARAQPTDQLTALSSSISLLMGADKVLRSGIDKIRARYLDLDAFAWPKHADGGTQSVARGDVVVVDVQMGGDSDAVLMGNVVGACRILLVRARDDGDGLAPLGDEGTEISIGAVPRQSLSHAVERVYAAAPKPLSPRLSTREREVLKDVAGGMSNKQIARRLGLSENTIRNHLSRAFGKLKACNRTEAVMRAVRVGMLDM